MFLSTICKNEDIDININTSNLKPLLPYTLTLGINEVWSKIIPEEQYLSTVSS